MRFATILPPASPSPLAVMAAPDGTWLDLAALAGRPFRALEDALPLLAAQGPAWRARAAAWHGPRFRLGEFHFLAPVVRPPSFRDFYAFEQHVKTARAARGLAMVPAWYEIPVFYFSNPGALVGHDAAVCAPAGCAELDYELELGVVIGRGGKNIPTAQAWEHIAGLTVLNDFSARDLQREEMTVGLGPAKAKDFATGAGPWLTTRDDVADRLTGETLALAMIARVNGRELSRGNAASLHHSIPQLVAQASRDAELFPGDLLGTGTVGTGCILELRPENTGGWLQPGDVVELEIERLGVLRHRIVARPA